MAQQPERISVCYTNVDVEDLRPDAGAPPFVRQDLGPRSQRCRSSCMPARICSQKQPDVFAATILRLHERGLKFAALVAGSGPDSEWLRSFVIEHGLHDRVRLLGEVPPEQVKALMQASDIFFLPSAREGIALSIYEAMACGLRGGRSGYRRTA